MQFDIDHIWDHLAQNFGSEASDVAKIIPLLDQDQDKNSNQYRRN